MEQLLSQIMEGWRDGIIMTDRSCNITVSWLLPCFPCVVAWCPSEPISQISPTYACHPQFANKEVTNIFGYSRDELVGSNVSLFCPEPHASRHDEYLQAFLETGYSAMLETSLPIILVFPLSPSFSSP